MAEFRPGTPDQTAFLADLVAARPADRKRRSRGLRTRGGVRACAWRFRRAHHAHRDRRWARADGLPAAAASRPAREDRLPEVVSASGGRDLRLRRRRGAGHRAGGAREPARGLERVPGHDRSGTHAGGLLSGLSGGRSPRAPRSGRHHGRRGRVLRVPPRALGRSGAPADVPPARDRADRRAGDRGRLARRVARSLGGSSCSRSDSTRASTSRTIPSSGAADACWRAASARRR